MSIRRAKAFVNYDEYDKPYADMTDDPDGSFVHYADHLDELRACEQRVTKKGTYPEWVRVHKLGWNEALDAADAAVLPYLASLVRHAPTEDNWEQTDALIRRVVTGIKAAIRALKEKNND